MSAAATAVVSPSGVISSASGPPCSATASISFSKARSLALLRRGRLRLLAHGDFLRAELRDAFDQLHGDGLGEREADRALVDLVRRELGLERCHEVIVGGIERVVLTPSSEIEHGATVQFVRGDLI